MKKLLSCLALVGALAVAGCGSSDSSSSSSSGTASDSTQVAKSEEGCPNDPVRFAVEPYDTGANLTKAYEQISAALEAKLGCSVELTVSSSYVAEIEAMRAGQIEIGEFGALGYAFAHKIADAEPVAAFGESTGKPSIYYAGIWTPKSSGITSLKQLEGETLGLADSTSTSGALEPVYGLEQAGFDCEQTASCDGVTLQYTGGHAQSMLALTHGTVSAAEVNTQEQSVAEAAHQFDPSEYRQLWKSKALPNDPITVRGDLPAAFKAKVKAALLSLTPAELKGADAELDISPPAKMVAVPDALYDDVIALADKLGLDTSALG
jgi:phosphonate transport system substrate-binding protein